MNNFIFKRKLPLWELILGLSALIIGTISLIKDLKGFILIGLGIYLLLKEGSEINVKDKKYRHLKSLLGLNFGKWKPLPEIEYLSVFRTNETTTLRSRSAEANVSNEIIKLNLFYDKNQKIEAYSTYDINDAFTKAKELALLLKIDILDATKHESKWL